MYQIFYIDIDEEITSVIDRLRKSKTTENFFVVSPRALILQSVVSLKLFKKEAAKGKKQVAIVVNDQEAKMKIEKAGILVLSSLKGLEGGEEIKENFSPKMKTESVNKAKNKNIMDKGIKKTRLQKIGSDDFFSEEKENKGIPSPDEVKVQGGIASGLNYQKNVESYPPVVSRQPDFSPASPSPVNRGPVMDMGTRNSADVPKEKSSFSYLPEKNFDDYTPNFGKQKEYGPNAIGGPGGMDPYKEKLVEGFFRPEARKSEIKQDFTSGNSYPSKETEKNIPVSHRMRKIFAGFISLCVLAAIAISAYLFLPKAKIIVTVKDGMKKVSFEAKGNINTTEIKTEELTIPAQIIEKENSLTESFKSSGQKSSSSDTSQKAKGKITIYNDYNTEPQQLVATTRFLTAEGKLFRLVKGVTVPGMNGSASGTIEADVIADQPGEDYNIEPSTFKIPGFEGSPKYDKFYAKSVSAMSGGGLKSGGVTIISQNDLESAKKESEEKLKDQLEESIKSEIGAGKILIAEAEIFSVSESLSTSKVNEVASSFDYKAKGKIKAIVFSESDLKKLAGSVYSEENKLGASPESSSISVEYKNSSADFSSGILSISVQAQVSEKSDINWDEFKNKLLGKDDNQIREVLKEFPQAEKINIDFWPEFMSKRIPRFGSRVTIEVQK